MAKRVLSTLASLTWTVVAFTFLLDTAHGFWSCANNATTVPVDIDKVSGIWYEVARFPQSEIPACLEVIAPNAVAKDEYTLQLDYVNNVNKGWKRTRENITFPWNNETESGLFKLSYKGGNVTVNVNFKYMGTFQNMTVVCGYSGVASGITILRLLSRNKTVISSNEKFIENILHTYGVDPAQLTWVEQGGKCNGASAISSSLFVGLIALFASSNLVSISI